MKRNIILAAAALLGAMSPLFSQEPASAIEQTQPAHPLGKEAIAAIRTAYEKGEYNAFLKQMENDYQQARQKGELANLVDFRMGPADSQWMDLEKTIRKERSQDLLSLIEKEESTPFVQKVQSAAKELSPDAEKAFSTLSAFRHMTPGSGKNSEENQLIDLDLAYEYKAIHLDLPLLDGQTLSDRREKHYVLRMEKMDKVVEASKNFQDASLKQAIATAAENFDDLLIQSWDRTDLNALAKGRVQPASKLEEKTAALLNTHQEKFADLSRQLLETQTTNL